MTRARTSTLMIAACLAMFAIDVDFFSLNLLAVAAMVGDDAFLATDHDAIIRLESS